VKILRVIIQNWRSVKYADFEPADMTILVGANNAGKTNILTAINFLMGDRWPMPANLQDSDFYLNDRRREIFIQLDFEDAPYSRLVFDTSLERYVFQAYDRRGQPVRGGFDNTERAKLAFAYVDASRNFDRQFGVSRWTLFGQAVRFLHDDLLRSGSDRLPKLRELLAQAHGLLKTELYDGFEAALREAFAAQLRTSRYDVKFRFQTIDETNLYRSLYPTLIERGATKSPNEAGSGVRNLLVLALFHAFATAFKGGAILGIEEPELFLHPHAQRSLMGQFENLVAAGNQLFISSHSATFLDITKPERIVVVECTEDDEDEICTQVRTTTAAKLLSARQQLHPEKTMTLQSMRAFLRNVRTMEMSEPYFARLVIIAEGPSEREALPLLCAHLGLNFDEEGISIIGAGGKTVMDTIVQVYQAHEIPTYVIFDNDSGLKVQDRNYNRVICRLLKIDESDAPKSQVTSAYAILNGDWEAQMMVDLDEIRPGLYIELVSKARQELGILPDKNKPLVARLVAEELIARRIVPTFVQQIVSCLKQRVGLEVPTGKGLFDDDAPSWLSDPLPPDTSLDDELPF
jgi:putative ATP-dependent endonuclease of the OLD family